MDELHQDSFTGLRVPEQPIGPRDFIKGQSLLGDLGSAVLLDSGDYRQYVCTGQEQGIHGVYDTDDCTGFGYCDRLATHMNCMAALGKLSKGFMDWATANNYIQSGSFMFDPQVLGIMAGTTVNGNWLQIVAEAARKNGLAPAGTLPGVAAYKNAADYYAEALTDKAKSLCADFKSRIDLPYQWDTAGSESDSLKAGPLYAALTTCGGWNSDSPILWCNSGTATNHAVAEVASDAILDSYKPFMKTLSSGYGIPYIMQVLVVELKGNSMQTIGFQLQGDQTVYVQVGSNLIAVADWQSFVNLGGSSNSVVTLTADQFAKFTVVSSDLFKSK